jgi:hypothetical protein
MTASRCEFATKARECRPGGPGNDALRSSRAAFGSTDHSGTACARKGGVERLARSRCALGRLILVTVSTSLSLRGVAAGPLDLRFG